jgi:hypothetical protein
MFLLALALAATLDVPRAAAPVIDGSVADGEWKSAKRVELTNGGHALLQHDGTFLSIAIRGPRTGIASLCMPQGKDVAILHASAALGTAVFKDGRATREFAWTNRDSTDTAARDKFLAAEHWFGNATPRGHVDREMQIAIDGRKEIPLTIAFMSFAPNEEQRIHLWPAELKDACASIDLASGKTEGTLVFDRAQWGMLRLR